MMATTKSGKDDRRHSVAIVGAGIAGIAAARQLADNGNFDVIVLEAHPTRYGGRIHSLEVPQSGGKVVELGAMWIHAGTNADHPISQLCQRFNIETTDFHIGKPGHLMAFDEDGRQLSVKEEADILNAVLRLGETLVDTKKRILESNLPDISVDTCMNQLAKADPDFVKQEVVQQVAVPFLESYNAAIAPDLSVKFLDGVPNSPERVEIMGEDVVLPYGYKALLDKIVATGPRFPISLDRRVERITIDYNKSTVCIVAADHKNHRHEYNMDHVIVAVPLGVLKARAIHFEPNLSPAHLKAVDHIGFGSKIKVLLVYEQAFWPDAEMLYVRSKHWPMFLLNLRRVNGLNGLLTTLDAVESNLLEALPDHAIVELMVDRLARIVGQEKIRSARLIYSKVAKWNSDPLVRGAYSFGKIGMRAEDAYAVRQPVSPFIFFAGEHTQFPEGEPGTVVAAYVSGQRAAEEITSLHRGDGSTKKVHFGIDRTGIVSKM